MPSQRNLRDLKDLRGLRAMREAMRRVAAGRELPDDPRDLLSGQKKIEEK